MCASSDTHHCPLQIDFCACLRTTFSFLFARVPIFSLICILFAVVLRCDACRKHIGYLSISLVSHCFITLKCLSLSFSFCLFTHLTHLFLVFSFIEEWQRRECNATNGACAVCVDMWVKSWRTHSSKEKMGHLRTRHDERDWKRQQAWDEFSLSSLSSMSSSFWMFLLLNLLLQSESMWWGDIFFFSLSCPLICLGLRV